MNEPYNFVGRISGSLRNPALKGVRREIEGNR